MVGTKRRPCAARTKKRRGGLTDGRDRGNNFSQFELVQDGGLSSSIQSDHQDPHFFLAKQALKSAGQSTHLHLQKEKSILRGQGKIWIALSDAGKRDH